jgi:hypothetical protein
MFYIDSLEQVGVKNFLPSFWSKVDISLDPLDCWQWQGAMSTPNLYGLFRFNGRVIGAHRVALYLCFVDIPHGLVVMHDCDNPRCCNPIHLTIGTHLDNLLDAVKKGRRPKAYKKPA